MKTFSLLKAILSQDMQMFNYTAKRSSKRIVKVGLPILIFLLVCLSFGSYAYMMAKALHPFNLTYTMLSMFLFMVTILTFIEGIFKSQGILFEAKDNDLLFSLPIPRSKILFLRIFKLLLFQYIFNLMFLLPAYVVYIYFEHPGFNFYIISLLMTILLPIIPTIISSALGYLVKLISNKSKYKKLFQTLLSFILCFAIYYASSKLDGFINDIASKASNINDLLIKIYYPIGSYIKLILNFDFVTLLKLLIINIIPFILFIIVGSKFYFKIISREKNGNVSFKVRKGNVIKRSSFSALVRKELKRYFSSPVYVFNTSFGMIVILVLTIAIAIKGSSIFDLILKDYGYNGGLSISVLYYFAIMFVTCFTSITSSCVSLEGKTINITKSLPIDEKTIILSKICYPFIIELPLIIISEIVFFIVFKPSLFYMFIIVFGGILSILLSSCIGLFINLKYPKMNAMNDTEVVKQSMSSMMSIFLGMIIFLGSVFAFGLLYSKYDTELLLSCHFIILGLISFIFYSLVMKYGPRDYKNINV